MQEMVARTIATTMTMMNAKTATPTGPLPPPKPKPTEGVTYNQFKLAALMGFSGVMTPHELPRIWSLFTLTKDVDTHRVNIFASMMRWATANNK